MSKDSTSKRLYNLTKACRSAVNSLKMQGHEQLIFTAALTRKGKRLNSIERADPSKFSRLLLNYVRNEDPDKLKIEILGERDELLWNKTFTIETESDREIQNQSDFRGLGEAEVSNMVAKQISEIRKNDELEELRNYRDQLEGENDKLRKELGHLEEKVEAKGNVEYYLNLVGLALPGVAKMLSKSPMGGALGFLAGTEDDSEEDTMQQNASSEPHINQNEQDQTIVQLITEYLSKLDSTSLQHIYLIFIELSNNPALISQILAHITNKNTQHDYQETN